MWSVFFLSCVGVWVCRHLSSQLAEMERAIVRMMEADLVRFAMEDIHLRMRAVSHPHLSSDVITSEVYPYIYMYIYTCTVHVRTMYVMYIVYANFICIYTHFFS